MYEAEISREEWEQVSRFVRESLLAGRMVKTGDMLGFVPQFRTQSLRLLLLADVLVHVAKELGIKYLFYDEEADGFRVLKEEEFDPADTAHFTVERLEALLYPEKKVSRLTKYAW